MDNRRYPVMAEVLLDIADSSQLGRRPAASRSPPFVDAVADVLLLRISRFYCRAHCIPPSTMGNPCPRRHHLSEDCGAKGLYGKREWLSSGVGPKHAGRQDIRGFSWIIAVIHEVLVEVSDTSYTSFRSDCLPDLLTAPPSMYLGDRLGPAYTAVTEPMKDGVVTEAQPAVPES